MKWIMKYSKDMTEREFMFGVVSADKFWLKFLFIDEY